MALSSKAQNRIVWGVRIVLAVAFGAAGAAKLAGAAPMVEIFDHIGAGQWFRYLTGAVELTGVLLLLVPAAGRFGALLVGVTMVCAIATHLLVIGGSPVPAIVLGALCAFVLYRLRPAPGASWLGSATRA